MSDAICANCSAVLAGEYCASCGQRRFRPEDRRFGHLLRQFFEALTDLDGRFWGSLRALMFHPGRLSRDYLEGRRVRWMSPVALFLFANLIYFLAPALSDFDLPLRNQVSRAVLDDYAAPASVPPLEQTGHGQAHSSYSEPWVRAVLDRRQRALDAQAAGQNRTAERAFDALERDYDAASANYSKLLIVLHVPFLALGFMGLLWRTRRYYAEHFVVALHYFAFVLCFVELVFLPTAYVANAMGVTEMPGWLKWLSLVILCGYAARQIRVGYGVGWIGSLLGGVAIPLLLLVVNVTVYRALQFAIVLLLS